jgi:hypothetical protein
MPGLGFEPTTPVIVRTKTFHALDRAATVVCRIGHYRLNLQEGSIVQYSHYSHCQTDRQTDFTICFV